MKQSQHKSVKQGKCSSVLAIASGGGHWVQLLRMGATSRLRIEAYAGWDTKIDWMLEQYQNVIQASRASSNGHLSPSQRSGVHSAALSCAKTEQ